MINKHSLSQIKINLHLRLCELLLQFLHLLPQLPDDPGIGVLIHHCMVDDVLGPVSVTQSGERLIVVVCCRADGGDHGSPTVPSKAVLQGQAQKSEKTS